MDATSKPPPLAKLPQVVKFFHGEETSGTAVVPSASPQAAARRAPVSQWSTSTLAANFA